MTTKEQSGPPASNPGWVGLGGRPPWRPAGFSGSPRIGGWGGLILSVLSGLLLAGALPALDWGWLAWVGLIPFLSLFPFRSKRAAFGHGLVLGTCYLGVMAYWIIVFAAHLIGPALSTLGWALVTTYQAFYIGVWAGREHLNFLGTSVRFLSPGTAKSVK